MIIGVPVFAVLYMLLSDFVQRRLEKKGRPLNTEVYEHIKSTDDIALMQKRIENGSKLDALAQEGETYDPEPEIEDMGLLDDMIDDTHEPLDEQEIASLLKLLDDSK